MRLVNFVLDFALQAFLVLLMLGVMQSQTQGNLPNVKDSAIDGIIGGLGAGRIAWPENVAIGDTLVMCNATEQPLGPFAMSDTLANSWTCTTPTQTPAPATNSYINMCYTKSTSAGADTLTYAYLPSAGDGSSVAGRFSGLGVVDGSVASGTFIGVGAGGTGTVSTSQTTNANNDSMISCGANSTANTGHFLAPASPGEIIAQEDSPVLAISRTGTKGTQGVTYNTWNGPAAFGANTTFALQTLAFKPNTNIQVVDTKLPDAASGVAYSAQLHCIGGTAAQTYSVVSGSLPTGITLTGATGVLTATNVTGTTQTVGFQCTDGTLTSATDTLTLTVGTAFNTPFVRSYNTNFNGVSGTVTGAVCGDMIHVLARGNDTHSDSGWIGAVSGANNSVSDSLGSPVQRMLLPIAGTPQSPIIDYVIGPLPQSGTDTISIVNNQSANSGLPVSGIFDVANVQSVSDQGALGENIIQNGTISSSFTSVVPNTLLLTGASVLSASAGPISISLGAPFTSNSVDSDIFGYSIYGNALIAAAGSTTATYTITGATGFGDYGAIVVPLRPALPNAACAVFSGAGEKIRRQVF